LSGHTSSLAQRQIGHVTIGRRPHCGAVQVPLRAVKLGSQLLNFGLALLHVEGSPAVPALEFREL
jgi:hypothetical protein